MKMTRSRGILAIILKFIIAFCTTVLLFSFVFNLTFASSSYFASRFPADTLAAQCDEQLTLKYEMLSKESGFPVRVFEMIKTDIPTAKSIRNALGGLETAEEVNIYSQSLVEFFYDLCEDYANGNNLKYKKADLKATAEKAARIYSDTVGIHNIEGALEKRNELKHKATLAQLVSFVTLVFSGLVTVLMYTRRHLGFTELMSATLGGGLATLFACILLYAIKPVQHLDITPAVFAECINAMSCRYFAVTALLAVAVIVASLTVSISLEVKYQRSKDKVKII